MGGISQVVFLFNVTWWFFSVLFTFFCNLISDFPYCQYHQDYLGDDFKSQGSHVPYNMTDFSTQV